MSLLLSVSFVGGLGGAVAFCSFASPSGRPPEGSVGNFLGGGVREESKNELGRKYFA
jgi:hypothetical protein